MIGLVRRFVGRFGLPLVILSLIWLSWQFFAKAQAQGLDAIWNNPGDGSMSTLAGIDLVMAMPVSWLPLVADFARYGKSGTGDRAFRGTWLGFAIANIWCHALGVLIVSTTPPGADLMATLLLAQGGLIALGLILIDEMDNAYGDVYSGSVSLNFLNGRFSIRFWGIALALLATGCALVLPMHRTGAVPAVAEFGFRAAVRRGGIATGDEGTGNRSLRQHRAGGDLADRNCRVSCLPDAVAAGRLCIA